MTAFVTTTTNLPVGTDKISTYNGLITALQNAGYPTPATFTSGSVTIKSFNVPIPNSTRTATLLIRVDTNSVLTSASMIQSQVVDSTQYNSSTGVVTGGLGYQDTAVWSSNGTTLANIIALTAYKSKDSAGVEDDRFNTVAIQGVGAGGLVGMGLPYPVISQGSYPGDYNLTNHCLAYNLSNLNNNNRLQGTLALPNPFSTSTTITHHSFTSMHEALTCNLADVSRQIVPGVYLKYTGTQNYQNSIFAHCGNDIAFCSAIGSALMNTFGDGKWQLITANTANGGILYRIAD